MDTAQRLQPPHSIPSTNSEIAKAYLARGEVAEAEEQWGLALEHYGIGLSLLPKDTKTGYFLFNNAAHCLNALELYSEGESYCRRAIDIDPTRPEAYRNLAVSRHGQGNLRGSALCLVEAIKINPSDERTVQLLKQFLTDNPTLSLQCSRIARELELVEHK
ncbi:MAG TPA: tetratricopeptide repeat protein [Candidatus Binatia bacterium]